MPLLQHLHETVVVISARLHRQGYQALKVASYSLRSQLALLILTGSCVGLATSYVLGSLLTSRHSQSSLPQTQRTIGHDTDYGEYTRDLSRIMGGRVQDDKGLGISSTIVVFNPRLLSSYIHTIGSFTEWQADDLRIPTHTTLTTDPSGEWSINRAQLGNWTVFVFPSGVRTPKRVDNVLVLDGLGADLGALVVDSRPSKRLVCDIDLSGLLLGYAGWWPDLTWLTPRRGDVIDFQWRDPDGYPSFLVVKERGAYHIRLIDVASNEDIMLSHLDMYRGSESGVLGEPTLIDSFMRAISYILEKGVPLPVAACFIETAESGELYIQTEYAFLPVSIQLERGSLLSAWADAYGEVFLDHVPAGCHTASAGYRFGGTTIKRGFTVTNGKTTNVEFTHRDRIDSVTNRGVALVGFITKQQATGVPAPTKGVLYCQPLGVSPRDRRRRVESDINGVIHIPNLVRGGTYELIYCESETDEYVRQVQRIFVPAKSTTTDVIVKLPMPSTDLHIDIPSRAKGRELLSLYSESSKRLCWSGRLNGQSLVNIRGVEAGTYRCRLHLNGQLFARSSLITVDGTPKEIVVDGWE